MVGERATHTLQPTALVGEAYARLAHSLRAQWSGTREFYFAAARAMQQILIEHARKRGCVKRGGDWTEISLDVVDLESEEDCSHVLTLDDAIGRLDKEDARAAEVVRLRFYAGLTVEQTAAVMEQSRRTVLRDWEFARAWLLDELRGSAD